ncbi:MAG: hypothetical protein AB7K24_22760 [Gemmataceae bacterium]
MAVESPSKKRADQVCDTLSDQARALLTGAATPRAYWERLVAKELYDDAIQFMARWLTKPQAVWWGCLCVWHCCGQQANAAEQAAWKAVVHWLQDPNEENRRLLEAVSAPLTLKNPIGAIAQAAFWSTGSMAPEDVPEVLPPEDLCAQVVAATLASLSQRLQQRAAVYPQLMQFAREVAGSANSWKLPDAERPPG